MRKQKIVVYAMFLVLCILTQARASDVVLKNNQGIEWNISKQSEGYAFGAITLNGKQIETPLMKGILRFINTEDDTDYWFYASKCKQVNSTKAILSGKGDIEGAKVKFKVTLETPEDVKAVRIIYDFEVDRDIANRRAVFQYNSDFSNSWKCHMYPFVEDSKWIKRDPLTDMGIPSLIIYSEDRSLGMMWGIDMNFDYLNPETWTKHFGIYFIDGVLPAQWRVGDNALKKSINYHCPMQIVLTDKRDPDDMIIDLVQNWIVVNDYKVEPLSVRTDDEALEIFIEGRKDNVDAYLPGKGYSLFGRSGGMIYMGVQSMGPYFDYMLYEMTGDPLWRQRAFEQMDFVIQGQNRDPMDHNYGAVHTTYTLSERYASRYGPSPAGWCSDDRWNIGYKPDICALLARYMLQMWKLVKDHEGIDRQDWYETAILMIDWILRQENNDGGLPQKVQLEPIEERWFDDDHKLMVQPLKSRSSTAGRALPGFYNIFQITGDKRYRTFLDKLEAYHLTDVQNRYYFTSHHPDLPPYDFEEASIWGVCEHWLNRHDEDGKAEYLKHAVANGYLALTWWCPKQLSWVDNPTQGGSAEQIHFLQYSVYNYQCRKVEGLKRLYDKTQNPLFGKLYERVLQNIYFTQKTEGINKGGTYERIADPWLARDRGGRKNYNSFGTYYTNEQALDCFVQTFEMYRTGKGIYYGNDLTNKVFPDGVCYYSRSNQAHQKVDLKVLPSKGSVRVVVESWGADQKSWTVGESSESTISTSCMLGYLEPGTWVEVFVDSDQVGKFQANTEGVIQFSYTGDFKNNRKFEVR